MKRRVGFVACLVTVVAAGCGPSVSTSGGATGSGSGSGASEGTAEPMQGDSSSTGEGSSTGLMVCEPDAITCDGSELGTWRLSSADAQVAAYFYLWQSPGDDRLQFVSRWFVDDEETEYCTRNGTYAPSGELDGVFVFQVLTQGGTSTPQCGGDPGEHTLRLELTRRYDCVGHVLEMTATDSKGASLYAIEGEAVHCGCNTGYDPYSGQGAPLPIDTCLSP